MCVEQCLNKDREKLGMLSHTVGDYDCTHVLTDYYIQKKKTKKKQSIYLSFLI